MLRRLSRWVVGLLAVLLLLVLGSRAAFQVWPFEGYVTRVNCDRIKTGMTQGDVYKLLGEPGMRPDCGVGIPPGEYPEYWDGPGLWVCVDFDREGRVIRAQRWSKRP